MWGVVSELVPQASQPKVLLNCPNRIGLPVHLKQRGAWLTSVVANGNAFVTCSPGCGDHSKREEDRWANKREKKHGSHMWLSKPMKRQALIVVQQGIIKVDKTRVKWTTSLWHHFVTDRNLGPE